MAVIHQNFVDLMDRLVRKNGRAVVIRRQTGTTLKDPTKPELGTTTDVTDTAAVAAFLEPDLRDLLLLLPGVPDQQTLVAREIDRVLTVPAKGIPFEIETDHKIVEGAGGASEKVWEITQVNKIEPGPTLIGYFLRVAN